METIDGTGIFIILMVWWAVSSLDGIRDAVLELNGTLVRESRIFREAIDAARKEAQS